MVRGNHVTSNNAEIGNFRKLRLNFKTVEFHIRYQTRNSGSDYSDFTVGADSYASPEDTVPVSSVGTTIDLPESHLVWKKRRGTLELPASDTAQFWRFRINMSGLPGTGTGTVRIDSVFIYPTADVFGSEVVFSKVIAGSVPEAVETTDANKYLAGDGTWKTLTGSLSAVKTADEAVNNSAALQDDDDLFVTLAASTYYDFLIVLHVDTNGSVNPDFKWQLVAPTNGTGFYSSYKTEENVAGVATEGNVAIATTNSYTVLGAARDQVCIMQGTVYGGDGGTFKLTWAQNVADATNSTTIKAGSTMRCIPIGT
jgi:hypothetical protein